MQILLYKQNHYYPQNEQFSSTNGKNLISPQVPTASTLLPRRYYKVKNLLRPRRRHPPHVSVAGIPDHSVRQEDLRFMISRETPDQCANFLVPLQVILERHQNPPPFLIGESSSLQEFSGEDQSIRLPAPRASLGQLHLPVHQELRHRLASPSSKPLKSL